ncbi:MAG: isoprenylcysteine carboxylmethyltransferase family protein [Actinobacteria bacterium]|nr:isoprenylcysteine carboxylmethyltransferase family protein [Actinomycetota bacterium]
MGGFRDRGGRWVVGQFGLLAIVAFALLSAGEDWGLVARIAGAVLVALGATLTTGGLITLGDNLTPFPAPRSESALVERGVYRVVRHPIYGGIVLGSLGAGIFDGNLPAIWASVALMAYLWTKAGHEEGRLLARHPDYADYRGRVRGRLIPWVF